MYDIPWFTVVIGWTIMFVSYSVTKLKIHRCGGGLYTMDIPISHKQRWFVRFLMLIYILSVMFFSFKVGFKDLDILYRGFSEFFQIHGAILFVIAIIVYIDARITISGNSSWSGKFKNDRNKLITTGIYGKIRHPEPLAYFLALIATSFLIHSASIFVFALLLVPMMFAKSIIDEQYLRFIFPEYEKYVKKTGRFFLR
ncbi:hypothetical protein J7J83_01985 [bacterium]|nr:hypothetical protein [bacterium]